MPEPVRLGDVIVGEPIRTSWTAPHGPAPEGGSLDQLTDVSGVADAPAGSVLVKDPDGILRPRVYEPHRGAAVTLTDTDPTTTTGVRPGDIHITRAGDDLRVWQAEER